MGWDGLETFQVFFADLHVHVGRDSRGRPVKVSASSALTLRRIVEECATRKGIQIVGVVDCGSAGVLEDAEALLQEYSGREADGGGIVFGFGGGRTLTVLLASEIEVPVNGSSFHLITYLPDLDGARRWSAWLEKRVRNPRLSTQRCSAGLDEIVETVSGLSGFSIFAHAFTPHKGILGCCCDRLQPLLSGLPSDCIPAVELGLSADSDMADMLSEMHPFSFVSNSDAHSASSIAREYNAMFLREEATFEEVALALQRKGGRRVLANYGLDPRLGKYHRSFCSACERVLGDGWSVGSCPFCGSSRIVRGVYDRVLEIADLPEAVHPAHRPPYVHQVPLSFIPGLGKRTVDRLIARFGSEMEVLHRVTRDELAGVVGETLAGAIVAAREGRLRLKPGGGGVYGRVEG